MTPKKHLRISLAVLAIIFGYTIKNQPTPTSETLNGSWELTHYIPHDEGKTEWTAYGDSIIYQKHISNNHFIWFKYDNKNKQLLGLGGGNYEISNGYYTENIKYFYPPGSSELGQSIPFSVELTKEDNWLHAGYAKIMSIDEATGQMVVTDSSKIEEKWVRTTATSNPSNSLQGTWDLIKYRESENGNYIEYPDYVGYVKVITPSHFIWVYYNKNDDEIYAAGSGKYTFSDNIYSETIEMVYPENTGQLGETIAFEVDLDKNQWKHVGKLPQLVFEKGSNTKIKTYTLIDEIWKVHMD